MSTASKNATFGSSLLQRADAKTAEHSREGATAAPPPMVTAQSPLHEMLIDEIAAAIPHTVAARLRASQSVSAAHDWIAAGAMYTWVKSDQRLAQTFLAEMGDRPQSAALALAKTVARTLPPPPPDAQTVELDRLGVALQLFVAWLLLVSRGIFFLLLFVVMTQSSLSLDLLPQVVTGIALPDLLWREGGASPLFDCFVRMGAAQWLVIEFLFVPPLLAWCRRFPLGDLSKHIAADWRADALSVFWMANCVLLQAGLAARTACVAIAAHNLNGATSFAVIGMWLCAVLPIVELIAASVRSLNRKRLAF